MSEATDVTRRAMLSVGLACAGFAARAQSAQPPGRRLAFDVWRGGQRIGHHTLAFSGGAQDFEVAIEAIFAVSLGPIVVFRYRHQATETWRRGQFAALQSHTVTNGKHEQVDAARSPAGVVVRSAAGAHTLPAGSHPLTHWNPRVLETPLFNPQTGAPMRESVSRQAGQSLRLANTQTATATRYTLQGDADIVDWYDAGGVWMALRARAKDGSYVDYRRAA